MKKRSLISAVAMLLVSALVLTSATFAWFASNDQATVSSFSAGIEQTGGNLLISADGAEFKTSLSQADYYVGGDTLGALKGACSGCRFPATLSPVSFDVNNASLPGIAGSIDAGIFETAAVPSTGTFVAYSVVVRADAACTVNVTLTATQTTAPYIWAAIKGTTAPVVVNGSDISGSARTYSPITTTTAEMTATDSNGDYIINSTEANTDVTVGTTVTAGTNVGVLSFAAAGDKTITVIEWVEGQDAACWGTVSGSCSIALGFEIV